MGYKIDDILIRSDVRRLQEIIGRMKSGSIKPNLNHKFIWGEVQQSRLIESALMRIPLSSIWLIENKNGTNTIADGLQRLVTLQRYFDGEFELVGVSYNKSELEGKRLQDLPAKFQNRIEDVWLTLYSLDFDTPESVKVDVIKRVKQGANYDV